VSVCHRNFAWPGTPLFLAFAALFAYAGPCVAQVDLSRSNATIAAAGGSGSVQVVSTDPSAAWQASSAQAWLTLLSARSGSGNSVISYSIAPNPTALDRIATLTLTPAAGAVKTLSVTQSGATLGISRASANIGQSGGTGSFTVNTDSDGLQWTAVSSSGGLSVTSGASGVGTGAVRWSALPQVVRSSQPAIITVTPLYGVGKTFAVVRAGGQGNVILTPTSFEVNPQGGNYSIAVDADAPDLQWDVSVTPAQAWLTITSPINPGSGDTPIVFSVAPNPTGNPRTAVITLAPRGLGGGNNRLVNVTQQGAALTVSPLSMDVPPPGTTGSISVTSTPTDLTWNAIVSSGGDWLTITNGGSHTGSSPVNWTATSNALSATGRSARITITPTGGTAINVVFNQAAGNPGTISVNPTAVTAPPSVSGGPIQVTTTTQTLTWTAAVSPGQTWLTIPAGTAGTGNGVFQYTATGNTTASERTATITATASNGSTATVTVTQQATTVSINPTSATAPGTGGTGSFNFVTNNTTLQWTAASNQEWLTVTPPSGTANKEFSWAAAAYPSTMSRTGTITVTPLGGGSPQVFTVTQQGFNGAITADPTSLTFAYQQLGSLPANSQVTLSSVPAGLPFTAIPETVTGGAWLAAASNNPATPASLTISVNPVGLEAGTYRGSVTINSPAATNNPPLTIPVTLTVTPAPVLTAQPNSLSFSYQQLGPLPGTQTIDLSASGLPAGVGLNFTIQPNAGTPWLFVTGSGPTPSTLTVRVNPAGLAPGTYPGTITVLAPSAGNSTLTIPVSLVVSMAPSLVAAPPSLSLTYRQLDPVPAPLSFGVTSTGSNLSYFTGISSNTSWLSVAAINPLIAGNTPSTVQLAINPASLAPGSYQGSVLLTSEGAANPLDVRVTLTVLPGPVLTAQPPQLNFGFTQGGTTTASSPLTISSDVPFSFTAAAQTATGGNWLSVQSPGTAETSATLTVSVSAAGLGVGTYAGTILVTSSQVTNSPLAVPVSLTVSALPQLTVTPSQLAFSFQLLSSMSPAPGFLTVTTTNGLTAPITATVATTSGGNWLSAGVGFTTPGPVSINATIPTGLEVGIYAGTVTLSSPGYASAVVPVTLQVSSAPTLQVQPTFLDFSYQQGGGIPLPQPVNVTSSAGSLPFSVSTTPGAPWLIVTGGGTTPTQFSVSVNPAGLAPETYSASVLVTSAQAGNSPVLVPVRLIVTSAPTISAQPSSLSFTYTVGGSEPASQPLSLSSSQPLTLSTAVSPDTSWLVLSGEESPRNVSINPGGLLPGQYTALLLVTAPGAGNSPLKVPVSLTVHEAPTLSPSPSQFTFSYQTLGPLPSNQVLTVNGSDPSLVVTATATTITGGNWLSVMGGGNAPAEFSLTSNPAGLAPGTYQGSVMVSAANAANSPLTIPVTLVVSSAPVINAAPGQLSFSYQIGNPAPAGAFFQVTSSGGALPIQIDSITDAGGAWLQVTSGGMTPLTVTAAVNPSGLSPGTYTGTISLSSAGAGNSPLLVPVTLMVTTTAVLSAVPASVHFTVQQDATAPPAQVVRVAAGGLAIPVTYSVSPNAAWLTQTGGSPTPADLSISISPAGLTPGRYTAVVLAKSDFAANSPLEIPVTLDVSATPVLSTLPSVLRFTFDRLGARPPVQALSVVSSGAATDFTVSVAPGVDWLFASGSGHTPASISVAVDPGTLAVGEYQGTVLLTPATGTPLSVPVILTVSDAPSLTAQPLSLSFVYQVNGPLPSAQSVVVTSSRGSLPVTVAVQTFSGGAGWLAATGGGNTPTTGNVTVNPAGLGPGVYKGQIAFSAAGAGNSPLLVPVTLTVTAAPVLTTSPTTLSFAGQVNGAVPPNQTIILTSSDGSALPITSVVASSGTTWLSVSRNSDTTPATLTVAITPVALTAGTYQASIIITAPTAGNNPIIVPVVLVLAAQPSLTASTSTAVFAAGIGGSSPPSLPVNIGSTGAPLTFSTSVAAGAPWLSVTGSGTTPSTIQLGVNPAGLVAGYYSGAILVTSAGAANNPLLIPVNLIVTGAPLLTTTTTSLVFTSGPSGSPPPQTVHITSSAGALSVTASPSPATPWLSVTGSGNTPLDLVVSVNTSGLAPGTYQGAVQILAPGAGNSPLSIPVTLQISVTPTLQANPSPVSFSHQVNGPAPASQTIGVTLGGQPATGASSGVAPGAPWLSAQATGSQINIAANPAGLLPGTYTGSVSVTANGAANSPLLVPVNLTVTGFPEFDISQDAVAFVAVRDQSQPISTTVTLGSGGANPSANFELNVTASTWLTISPLTGTTPANLTITVNPAGLRPGSYSGSVIISSSGNRVRTLLVNLVVADAPVLSSSPPFLQFSYLQGGDLPSPVNLWVGRFGADVSVTATPSEPWISVDPSTPSTSGPIKVTVSPAGLSSGIHQAFILLTATTGAGVPVVPVKRVPLTLYVNQPANPKIAAVLNGMSFLDTPLVPGLIFSIFGTGLGPSSPSGPAFQQDGTLSQSVAGVEVLINGIPCPLLYVSSTQINAIAPYALFNRTSAQVAVRFLGILSGEVPVNVSPSLPGVFSIPQNGAGAGVILNQDLSVNTAANPAARQTTIAIFAGGGGQSGPQGLDGSINGTPPLPNLLLPVSVFIGGIPAPDISYAGAAPGFPDGSLQINVKIPDSVPSGNVPVIIRIGNATSQGGLTVSVK
jgi:large repetitive protein